MSLNINACFTSDVRLKDYLLKSIVFGENRELKQGLLETVPSSIVLPIFDKLKGSLNLSINDRLKYLKVLGKSPSEKGIIQRAFSIHCLYRQALKLNDEGAADLCLYYGANPTIRSMVENEKTTNHHDLLIRGMSRASAEEVKKNLEEGLSPDICMSNGMPAAEFLISDFLSVCDELRYPEEEAKNFIKKMTYLLEAGLNVITGPGLSTLFTSIKLGGDICESIDNGDFKLAWLLFKFGASTESINSDGVPLCHYAFEHLPTNQIKEFVELNTNVNCGTLRPDQSALMYGFELGLGKVMIDAGAFIDEQDDSGKTTLMSVFSNGYEDDHLEAINVLLGAGAKPGSALERTDVHDADDDSRKRNRGAEESPSAKRQRL